MTAIRSWGSYFDKNQLPVTLGGDGGDCAANLGRYFLNSAAWFFFNVGMELVFQLTRDQYAASLAKLMPEPGVLIRHPDPRWSDPKDCSRDQMIPNFIAMGFFGMQSTAWSFFWRHCLRFGKYQNWDFSTPQDLSIWIRVLLPARGWRFFLFPVLVVSDLFVLLQSLIVCLRLAINRDDVADCLNHDCVLIQAYLIHPTPISWLARKVNERRPLSFVPEFTILAEPLRVNAPWIWYHRLRPDSPNDESPPVFDTSRPILKKVFS